MTTLSFSITHLKQYGLNPEDWKIIYIKDGSMIFQKKYDPEMLISASYLKKNTEVILSNLTWII